MTGAPLPIWLFHDSFISQITEQGMPANYILALEKISSPTMLIIMFIAPIIGALIGTLIAKVMMRKHFVKAGLV